MGSAEITNRLGLSTSLGAFIAGALLAETNYRTQIEADLQPIRGLLLGLFFMTTGASVDPSLVLNEWPTTLALLMGLIAFKSFITSGKLNLFFFAMKSKIDVWERRNFLSDRWAL